MKPLTLWLNRLVGLSLIAQLLAPLPVQAAGASLSISPGSVSTEVGKTFSVNVMVNAGEAINAASGTVKFPSNLLQGVSVSQSGSIFTLWTDNPSISSDSVPFGGGLSNPGHVGSGKMFSISFKAKAAGSGSISITGGKVLANDGLGTNVYSGASSASITVGSPPPTLAAPTISSSSHPDQSKWYQAKDLAVSWNKPTGATSLKYSLTSSSSSVSKSDTTTTTTTTFQNLSDGEWTFTVTAVYPSGERSTSFKAQIDTAPPGEVAVKVNQKSPTDPRPTLEYSAADSLSGIDHYEIMIDGGTAVSTTETTYQLPRQTPGTKTVVVKAIDKAGNHSEKSTTFVVEGFPGPVLLSVNKYVSVLQPIDIEGKGLFGAETTIFIDGKSAGDFIVKDHLKNPGTSVELKADSEVVWTYRLPVTLLPGVYKITANQTKEDGSESNLSNELSTRVLWSSVSLGGGLIVPMVIIVILLLLLLLLLILLLIYLWRKLKEKLPVVPLNFRRHLITLEEEIGSELDELERQVDKTATVLEKKPKVLKSQVTGVVEGTKRNIKRDIEKELTDLENSENEAKKS